MASLIRFGLVAAAVLLGVQTFAAASAADPVAGQEKASACVACHGLDGNSADPANPKIAGQHREYLARHLQLVKSGERQAPTMLEFVQGLSEQDMQDIGAYFATQKGRPGNAADEALAAKGQALYRGGAAGLPSCMGCHGPTGRGNPAARYPSLGGQHASYTKTQLERFRAGMVYGKDDVAGKEIMSQVAKNLSDADIAALSEYLQGLHSAE